MHVDPDRGDRPLRHGILAAVAVTVHVAFRDMSATTRVLEGYAPALGSRLAYAVAALSLLASAVAAVVWMGKADAARKRSALLARGGEPARTTSTRINRAEDPLPGKAPRH
ncbi:hypothetical protein [Paludisphaera sp.]|uniref:hypothetical protein n=1 Tax=Paludisphaera sp. TaxID=2017432 RepID=UPI00301B8AF1